MISMISSRAAFRDDESCSAPVDSIENFNAHVIIPREFMKIKSKGLRNYIVLCDMKTTTMLVEVDKLICNIWYHDS